MLSLLKLQFKCILAFGVVILLAINISQQRSQHMDAFKNLPSGGLCLIRLSYYPIWPWWGIVWSPNTSHVFSWVPWMPPLPILCPLGNNCLFQSHSNKHFWYSVQPDSDYGAWEIQGIKSLAICFPELLS